MLASESFAAASRNSSGTGRSGVSSVDSIAAAASASRLRRAISAMRIFRGYHLALLGHPDLAVHGSRRLREDGLIARPAAASHRSSTPVEKAQLQFVLLLEQLRQRD